MADWHGNEDAGDMDMMHRAAYGECRPMTCPECGEFICEAADFFEDEMTECDVCGELLSFRACDNFYRN